MLCYMYFGIFFIFDDFVTIVMCAKELNNYCFFLTGRYLLQTQTIHLIFFYKYCAGNIHRVIE